MKRALSHTLALISLGFTALAVTPIHAQTTAPGPYYATPSWDQQLPASTRFIVLSNWNNDAVLDRETGLVWEKVPPITALSNWFDASSRCINLNTGGRTGWHLPTIQELLSVVDRSQSNPSLPAGHPFTVQGVYWSATTAALALGSAYIVFSANGVVNSEGKNLAGSRAWCVRGGQGVDPQ